MCRKAPNGFSRLLVTLFFSLGCWAGTTEAQLNDADRQQLSEQIRSAAKSLDPGRLPRLDASKQRVTGAMERVKSMLRRRAAGANGEAWLNYLQLDSLHQTIETDGPLADLANESIGLKNRLIGTAPGLEADELQALRREVAMLIEAIRFRDQDRAIQSIGKQLESLAEQVDQMDDSPSAQDIATVSTILGLLSSAGQADEAVAALQAKFNQPNVAVMIREAMVKEVVDQDVHQNSPVRDCILGTSIFGTATMDGQIVADVLPSEDSARINVALAGHIVSNNTGYNGPVRLRTMGYGDVTASRTVDFDGTGVSMAPTVATAVLCTEINAIEHKLKIVRKIARKKAAKQKPLADRIATEKMRRRVADQFSSQIDDAGSVGSSPDGTDLGQVLQRLSLSEPSQSWSSTDDSIAMHSTFRQGSQLSAVVPRPAIDADFGAAIQVHESVINNAFSPILAGRTLKESELNELLEGIGRPATTEPQEGDSEEPEPPFEIKFQSVQPVVFAARDQTIRVGVRGSRFAQGSREIKEQMEITAIYKPQTLDSGKIVLVREGEVDVVFPGSRLTVSQAAMKPAIQKKFSRVFPDQLLDRELKVPEDSKLERLRGRVFETLLVAAEDGWLSIAIR